MDAIAQEDPALLDRLLDAEASEPALEPCMAYGVYRTCGRPARAGTAASKAIGG